MEKERSLANSDRTEAVMVLENLAAELSTDVCSLVTQILKGDYPQFKKEAELFLEIWNGDNPKGLELHNTSSTTLGNKPFEPSLHNPSKPEGFPESTWSERR